MDFVERQSALVAPGADDACHRRRGLYRVDGIRRVELDLVVSRKNLPEVVSMRSSSTCRLRRSLLKPLHAAPGHVLQHEQRTVRRDQHVQSCAADDDVARVFDHAGEQTVSRWHCAVWIPLND